MTDKHDNPAANETNLAELRMGDCVELKLRLRFDGTRNNCQLVGFRDGDGDEIVVLARDIKSIRLVPKPSVQVTGPDAERAARVLRDAGFVVDEDPDWDELIGIERHTFKIGDLVEIGPDYVMGGGISLLASDEYTGWRGVIEQEGPCKEYEIRGVWIFHTRLRPVQADGSTLPSYNERFYHGGELAFGNTPGIRDGLKGINK